MPEGRFTVSRSKCFIFFVQENLPCVFVMVQFHYHLVEISFGWKAVTVLQQSRVYRGINSLQKAEYFYSSLFLTLGGIPEISRHSLLEYCSFSKLSLSTLISLSDSLELTFLDLLSSASTLVNLVLSSSKLFFKSSRTELNCLSSPIINVLSLLYSVLLKMFWYDPYSCIKLKKYDQISTTKIKLLTTTCVHSLQLVVANVKNYHACLPCLINKRELSFSLYVDKSNLGF